MCCCSERVACIQGRHAEPRTTTHKAIYTCIDSRATQSSWSRANPSMLVDWDPITIPNRARMKEWQTACEQAHSLMVDWWDKSWGGSWGIPYRSEHTIKNLWCHKALGNRPFFFLPYPSMECVLVFSAFLCPKRRSRFCHSTIRSTLGYVKSFNLICPEWITVIFLCLMLQNILILFKQCRNILRWVQNRATVTRKEALQGFKVLKKEKLFDCQSGD